MTFREIALMQYLSIDNDARFGVDQAISVINQTTQIIE
jgi:hypothetical protein